MTKLINFNFLVLVFLSFKDVEAKRWMMDDFQDYYTYWSFSVEVTISLIWEECREHYCKCLMDDFTWECRMEKMFSHPTFFLKVARVHFQWTVLQIPSLRYSIDFSKEEYFGHFFLFTLDVNFSHKNDIFSIWV